MNDIAKCEGKGCDLRETCWRYVAESGEWQTWNNFHADPKPCKAYWPIKEAA